MTHYFNPRLKEKRFKPPMGYYMCADCERYRFATRYRRMPTYWRSALATHSCDCDGRFCPQCGDHYCVPCYKKQHKKGARAQHAWIPIPVKPVYCKSCNKRKALVKCFECQMPFCYDCNQAAHGEGTEWADHDVIEM